MKRTLPWLLGLAIYVLRMTCRLRIYNDPRARILDAGGTYVFAQIHAHQIAAAMYGEVGTGAMVSRSADGEMIVPTLRLCGKTAVRGSSGVRRKGGATALHNLIGHVRSGKPAVIAVDGPRGPRGHVNKGICFLAEKTGADVLPVLVIPKRRWILSKTWDRMQIPKPFATVNVYFGEPIRQHPTEDLDQMALRLQASLHELEHRYDPDECVAEVNGDRQNGSLRRAA